MKLTKSQKDIITIAVPILLISFVIVLAVNIYLDGSILDEPKYNDIKLMEQYPEPKDLLKAVQNGTVDYNKISPELKRLLEFVEMNQSSSNNTDTGNGGLVTVPPRGFTPISKPISIMTQEITVDEGDLFCVAQCRAVEESTCEIRDTNGECVMWTTISDTQCTERCVSVKK